MVTVARTILKQVGHWDTGPLGKRGCSVDGAGLTAVCSQPPQIPRAAAPSPRQHVGLWGNVLVVVPVSSAPVKRGW